METKRTKEALVADMAELEKMIIEVTARYKEACALYVNTNSSKDLSSSLRIAERLNKLTDQLITVEYAHRRLVRVEKDRIWRAPEDVDDDE